MKKNYNTYKKTSKEWLDSIYSDAGWKVVDYVLRDSASSTFKDEYRSVPLTYLDHGQAAGSTSAVTKYKKWMNDVIEPLEFGGFGESFMGEFHNPGTQWSDGKLVSLYCEGSCGLSYLPENICDIINDTPFEYFGIWNPGFIFNDNNNSIVIRGWILKNALH